MSKAISVIIDDEKLCCVCTLRAAYDTGAPHLFLLGLKTKIVDGTLLCPTCHTPFNSFEALKAADELSQIIKGEK